MDIAQVRKEVKKRGMTWPQVSSFGRFQDTFGVIKVPIPEAGGYVRVQVFGSKYCLHGLVARAFKGKAPPGHTVDHIDLNRRLSKIAQSHMKISHFLLHYILRRTALLWRPHG